MKYSKIFALVLSVSLCAPVTLQTVHAQGKTNPAQTPKATAILPSPETFGNDPEAILSDVSDSAVLDPVTGELKEPDSVPQALENSQKTTESSVDSPDMATELTIIDSLDQEYYNPPAVAEMQKKAEAEAQPKAKKSDSLKLGTGISNYASSSSNRKFNIKKAASSLNGKVIKPGQTFNFNATVGSASKSAGYKNAKVIVDGKFVDGYGGGVCQVSSTLFNAALNSGMDITQRRNHSVKISYLPAGYDAAVSYGSLNLKFKNTYKVPVKIKANANNSTITIDIVALDKTTKKVVSLNRTKQGSNTYTVHRTIKENNVVIKKDSFRSTYRERKY